MPKAKVNGVQLHYETAGVAFEDGGERELKGVSEPVRVWAVGTTP